MAEDTRDLNRAIRLALEEGLSRAAAVVGDREDGPQRIAMIMHVLATRLALSAGATQEQWQHDHELALGLSERGQDAPAEPLPHTAHWHRPKRRRGSDPTTR